MKKTPLHRRHVELGARLISFGGWEMPVSYEGVMAEHQAVRTKAGLFDVSHMGEFEARGKSALASLQKIVTNDLSRLGVGQALYTVMCLPSGGTIDDLLIYRRADDDYLIVVNAANIEKDFQWMKDHLGRDASIENRSDAYALLALQGPEAQAVLSPLAKLQRGGIEALRYYEASPGLIDGTACLVSRTGYTGEDGLEIYLAAEDAVRIWDLLLDRGRPSGLKPAGLGARDTLRLEMGYCLYGHELDETITPLEAGLGWVVRFQKDAFIGKEALLRQKAGGVQRKLVGLEAAKGGIPRQGYPVHAGGRRIGTVTSGTHSPTLGRGIGLALVEAGAEGPDAEVEIRGRRVPARICRPPFVPSRVRK